MEQPPGSQPPVSGASADGINKNMLIAVGVAGVIAAGVGVAYWLSQTKIKRPKGKRKVKTSAGGARAGQTQQTQATTTAGGPATSSGSASSSVSPWGKDARVTLETLSQMDQGQLQAEIERSSRENDKASQINILFFLANNLTSEGQLTAERLQEALSYYLTALEMAKEIDSNMQGVIQVELAVIFFIVRQHEKAMEMFEEGLRGYLRPEEENIDTKILLRYFVMLSECYLKTESHRRGIDFLHDIIRKLKTRRDAAEMLSPLYLSIGEFHYADKNFTMCVSELENAMKECDVGEELGMLYEYYLAWAYYKSENWTKAVEHYENYLQLAKKSNTDPANTIESIASMVDCYRQLKDEFNMNQTFDRALQTLNMVDTAAHPLIALKHYYFLGLFCYNKLEQLPRAKKLLKKALQLARTDDAREKDIPWASIATELGEVYHKMKKRKKALDVLNTAVTGFRNKEEALVPPVLLRVARIHSEMGHKNKSLEALNTALERCIRMKKEVGPSSPLAKQSVWMEAFLRYQLGKMHTLMGHLEEGHKLLTVAVEGFTEADLEMKAVIQASIASNRAQAGRRGEAEKILEIVSELTKQDAVLKSQAQGELATETGEIYLFLDNYEAAKKKLEEALLLCKGEKNDRSELAALVRLVYIDAWLGESSERDLLEEGKVIATGDDSFTQLGAVAAASLGHYLLRGNIREALKHVDTCSTYLDPDCNGSTPLNVLSFYAMASECCLWGQQQDKLILFLAKALDFLSSHKGLAAENAGSLLHNAARLAYVQLHMEESRRNATVLANLEEVLPLARSAGSKRHQAEILALLALFRLRVSKTSDTDLVEEALKAAEEYNDARTTGFINWLAALFYVHSSDAEKGERHLQQAVESARRARDGTTLSLALQELAVLARASGDDAKSKQLLQESFDVADKNGNTLLVTGLVVALAKAGESASPSETSSSSSSSSSSEPVITVPIFSSETPEVIIPESVVVNVVSSTTPAEAEPAIDAEPLKGAETATDAASANKTSSSEATGSETTEQKSEDAAAPATSETQQVTIEDAAEDEGN